MDKQPVGQLPELTQSANDDEIMVITNDEYNQLKKEKISDFITDLQSTNTNNSLTTGSDGKLFVSKTINASDVDGVLSLDNIPQLSTNKLPETGISANNYSYPASITVNDRGQVVSITEGSAAEAGAYLDQSQITNCILEAPNGVATFSGSTITVKQGLKVLIPNGRNEDKTLKNIEYTVPEDKTINYTGIGDKTYDFTLLYGNTGIWELSQNYQEADTPPTFYGFAQYYLNTKENIMYLNNNNESWEPRTVAVLGKGKLENGVVTSFIPYQPVELAKNNAVVHNYGNEEINGVKTFANGYIYITGSDDFQSINCKNPEVDYANLRADQRGARLVSFDKNDQYYGYFQTISISNVLKTAMGSRRRVSNIDYSSVINACVDQNGNTYGEAPTYTNYADSSGKIVTTQFLTNRWTTSKATTSSSASKARPAVVIQNYVNGTSWYRVWSDGWIEQGGVVTVPRDNQTTVTLLRAHANTNYSAVATQRDPAMNVKADAGTSIIPIANNQITIRNGNGETIPICWRTAGY